MFYVVDSSGTGRSSVLGYVALCHGVHLGEDTIVSSVLCLLPDHIYTCWTVSDLSWTCSHSGRHGL